MSTSFVNKLKYILLILLLVITASYILFSLYVSNIKKHAIVVGIPLNEPEVNSFFSAPLGKIEKDILNEYKKIYGMFKTNKDEYDEYAILSVLRDFDIYAKDKKRQVEVTNILKSRKMVIEALHNIYVEEKTFQQNAIFSPEDVMLIYNNALYVSNLYGHMLIDALGKKNLADIDRITNESFYFVCIIDNIPYLLLQHRANTIIYHWLFDIYYPYLRYTNLTPEKYKKWISNLKTYNRTRMDKFKQSLTAGAFFFSRSMDAKSIKFDWSEFSSPQKEQWKPLSFFWEKIKMLDFTTRLINDFLEPEHYYRFEKGFIKFNDSFFKEMTQDKWVHQKFENPIERYYQTILFFLQNEFYTYTMIKSNIVLTATLCYYKVHGKFPHTIDELVPEFLDKTDIIDPLSGNNFIFSIDEEKKSISISTDKSVITLFPEIKINTTLSISDSVQLSKNATVDPQGDSMKNGGM